MSGSVKFALGEYMRALRKMPNDPLLHLLIGNAYLAHVSYYVFMCVCFWLCLSLSVLYLADVIGSRELFMCVDFWLSLSLSVLYLADVIGSRELFMCVCFWLCLSLSVLLSCGRNWLT